MKPFAFSGQRIWTKLSKPSENAISASSPIDAASSPSSTPPPAFSSTLVQGKPVIAPRAPGILDYFGPEELILFELGDADDLAAKIEFVFKNPAKIHSIVERGQEVYRGHAWAAERLRFIRLTDELLQGAEISSERVQNRSAPVLGGRE